MEPFRNRLSGRNEVPIHSTIYSVAYCPWRGTLKTTTLLYEELKPLTDELKPNDDILAKADFRLVHMGGLRPFQTATPFEFFENDGLTGRLPGDTEDKFYESTGTPKIGQYLIIEADKGFVNFKYRNTGSLPEYSTNDKPEEYTIKIM